MGGRRCEGYGVCSDAAKQHFAKGKMLGGRSAVKKVCGDFFDKLSKAQASACALLFAVYSPLRRRTRVHSRKKQATICPGRLG